MRPRRSAKRPATGRSSRPVDRVGADHDPDRDVAAVERAVHVAGQHRQHGADREQPAEGDGEDAGEGDAGAELVGTARRARALTAPAPARLVDHVVGRRLRRLGLLAGGVAAEDEDRRQARPPAALDVGGDPVADHRHPLRVRRSAPAPARTGGGSGLPPVSARFPEAVSIAARVAPVPGQAPSGHRQRRVAAGPEQRRACLQGAGRGQQLGVVELAVAGDDHGVGGARRPRPRAARGRRPRPSP